MDWLQIKVLSLKRLEMLNNGKRINCSISDSASTGNILECARGGAVYHDSAAKAIVGSLAPVN